MRLQRCWHPGTLRGECRWAAARRQSLRSKQGYHVAQHPLPHTYLCEGMDAQAQVSAITFKQQILHSPQGKCLSTNICGPSTQ